MQEKIITIVQGLKKYFHDHGLQKAVLGLSGGVDSAVVAALAVRALGKENVCALLMPYSEFSSTENLHDARELAQILGIQAEEIAIDAIAREFFTVSWGKGKMTQANILPRIRMILLYAWANENNALVLGTCNKSETLLGYETKFGDGASDIAVIGALWKTEVWEMAKYLGLPKKFITKAPSAELYKDHTDEEEMGFSYQFADEVLQKWERGEELDTNDSRIQRILGRVKTNEHKRKMAPIIAA